MAGGEASGVVRRGPDPGARPANQHRPGPLQRTRRTLSGVSPTPNARKLARVLWHLLKFKEAFDWKVFAKEEEKMKRKKLARLQNLAAAMNYQLVPNQ